MEQVCKGAAEVQVKAERKLMSRHSCQDLKRPLLRALGFSSPSSLPSHSKSGKALTPIVISSTSFVVLNQEDKCCIWEKFRPCLWTICKDAVLVYKTKITKLCQE